MFFFNILLMFVEQNFIFRINDILLPVLMYEKTNWRCCGRLLSDSEDVNSLYIFLYSCCQWHMKCVPDSGHFAAMIKAAKFVVPVCFVFSDI